MARHVDESTHRLDTAECSKPDAEWKEKARVSLNVEKKMPSSSIVISSTHAQTVVVSHRKRHRRLVARSLGA